MWRSLAICAALVAGSSGCGPAAWCLDGPSGPLAEAALVTTTGGWTRVFTLQSGAKGELAGRVFDAEFTSYAAYAVFASDAPFFLDGELLQIPYDGAPPTRLLDSWGPMQVELAGSGELIAASGRSLLYFDPATGMETGTRQELAPPPSFDLPFPL